MRDPATTAETDIPSSLIDQVIGQERARTVVRLAAQQRRFVLLIGDPGTGKSLLGRSIAELLPATAGHVLACLPNPEQPMCPRILSKTREEWAAWSGRIQRARREQHRSQRYMLGFISSALVLLIVWFLIKDQAYGWALAGLIALIVVWRWQKTWPRASQDFPKILVDQSPGIAPFIDATACSEGALFGDVRHDPYQSGGQETPAHALIEPGAVHQAHGGVLYIDEIGSLSSASQKLLLTAIQDKALPITGRQSGSSGTLIRTAPVPCDFVLVAAGNVEDLPHILPALRSRILGFGFEVLTESTMPDNNGHRRDIGRFIAQEVRKDGRIPHFEGGAITAIVDEARRRAGESGQLSTRFRELGGLVRIAGDLAVQWGAALVTADHVREALTYAASIEDQLSGLKPTPPTRLAHNPSGPVRPA